MENRLTEEQLKTKIKDLGRKILRLEKGADIKPHLSEEAKLILTNARGNNQRQDVLGRQLRSLEPLPKGTIGSGVTAALGSPHLTPEQKNKIVKELEDYNKAATAYKTPVKNSIPDLKNQLKDANVKKQNLINQINDWETSGRLKTARRLNRLNSVQEALEKRIKDINLGNDTYLKNVKPTAPTPIDPVEEQLKKNLAEKAVIKNKFIKPSQMDLVANASPDELTEILKGKDLVKIKNKFASGKDPKFMEFHLKGITTDDIAKLANKWEVPEWALNDWAKKNKLGLDAFDALAEYEAAERELARYQVNKSLNAPNPPAPVLTPKEAVLRKYKNRVDEIKNFYEKNYPTSGPYEQQRMYYGLNDYKTLHKDLADLTSKENLLNTKLSELSNIKSQQSQLRNQYKTLTGHAFGSAGPVPPIGGSTGIGSPRVTAPGPMHVTPGISRFGSAGPRVAPKGGHGLLKAAAVVGTLAGGAMIASKLLKNEGKRAVQKVRIDPERYYVICEDGPEPKIVGSRLGYVNRDGAEDMRESFFNAGMYQNLRVNKGSTAIEKLGSVNFSHQYNFMNEETKEKIKTGAKIAAGVGGLALAGLTGYNVYDTGSLGAGVAHTVNQITDAASTVGSAVKSGAKYAANKAVDAGKWTADKAVKGAHYVAGKAKDAGDYLKNEYNTFTKNAKIFDKPAPQFAGQAAASLGTKAAIGHVAKAQSATGGEAAANAAKLAAEKAKEHASNEAYKVSFSNDETNFEKSEGASDKAIPLGVASAAAFGSTLAAQDKLNQSRLKRLKKLGDTANDAEIKRMSISDLQKLGKDSLAAHESRAIDTIEKSLTDGQKTAKSIGRGAAKLGRFALGAGAVGLATAGAYKLADKALAIKDNYDKAKYVPNLDNINPDKYYVIDQATDSHYRVMKSFPDYDSANKYKLRHKGIGPRGNLYVNRGSTLLNKYEGN